MDKSLARWITWATILLSIIVIPFGLFGATIDAWAVASVEAPDAGKTLVFILVVVLLAGDVLLPVPSSVLSAFAGVLLGLPLGAAASFVGMTLGCAIGYLIGRGAGRTMTARLVGPDQMERLSDLTARHGDWALAVCRAVPVLAEASVITAGAGSMRFGRFLLISTLANLGISMAYAAVGATSATLSSFLLALGGAILIPLAVMLFVRLPRALGS